MSGRWLKLALGAVAAGSGPLALIYFNQTIGEDGFATPIGGDRWFAPRPGFFEASGVHDPELSPVGSVFNWIENRASLRFTRVERSQPATVNLRIQGGRAEGLEPEVAFSVDGVETLRLAAPTRPRRVSLTLPPRNDRGAVVSIRVEDTKGVMVENVRLAGPAGPLHLTRESLGALAFAALATYSAALLCGLPAWISLGLSLLESTLLAWLSITGGAFLGTYSEHLMWIAGWAFVAGLAVARIREVRWRRAWLAVIWIAALKLSILGHPQIIDADAAFQASNLERVLRGDWFFTSSTPPPAISFPYPPGLSVAAMPFSDLPREQWVTLLRVIVIVTEILATALFSWAVASFSSIALGASVFVFLALSPEGISVLFVGNLANQFSDSLMILGCALLMTRRPAFAAFALLAGFLSHLGTLLVGAPLGLLLCFREPASRTRLLRSAAPVLLAIAASFVLYYRHVTDVVVAAWNQIHQVRNLPGEGPMTAPMIDKLIRMSGGEDWWVNAVVVMASLVGIATWPRNSGPLARVVFLWLGTIAGFVLLGLLTPLQVRAALSARPAIAVLSATGFCALWAGGRDRRSMAVAILALTGIAAWANALSFFPARPA